MGQIAIFNFVHLGRVNYAIKTLIENTGWRYLFFVNEPLALKNINTKLLIFRETMSMFLLISFDLIFETVLDLVSQ